MAKTSRGGDMQTDTTTQKKSSKPAGKEEKRLMQAEVNQDLFDAAEKVMEAEEFKIRWVMEFGLKQFLKKYDPKAYSEYARKERARLGFD